MKYMVQWLIKLSGFHLKVVLLLALISLRHEIKAQDSITTVIFVRHAEKEFDESGDPELTQEGRKRAQLLAEMLSAQKIDKIYSTPFKRTIQTVQPLADNKGIKIEEYNPFKIEESIELIKNANGQSLLFSGHSNTIPVMINKILGKDEFKMIDENDYSNLFILTLVNNQVNLIHLKFGSDLMDD